MRQEAEAFVSSSTKASMQKTGQELLNVMDASLALWRGDYETFRRMEEARSARYTAKLQKVVSAVCLADVDIACGELKNARTHLEYAIWRAGLCMWWKMPGVCWQNWLKRSSILDRSLEVS